LLVSLERLVFTQSTHSTCSLTTTITQIQSGKLMPIGVYDSKQDFLNLSTFGNKLTWQGERPPLDRPNTEPQLVDTWLVAVVFFLVGVCIMFAIAMLTVDWLYRKHSGLVDCCTAKFKASSIEALQDETNELEDAWEPTVELPKISGQQS